MFSMKTSTVAYKKFAYVIGAVTAQGVLDQYLGRVALLKLWKPDPVKDKNIPKYIFYLGQHPQLYFPV